MEIKRWDHLRTVLAVFRSGSYRAAAEELGLSSMTVGRHIEGLEQDLGAPVFLLRDKRWEATPLGRQLVRVATDFGSELDIALRLNADDAQGFGPLEISTVSFINMFFLSPNLHIWSRSNPGSLLTIDASEDSIAVENGKLDAALRLAKPEQIGLVRQKVALSPIGLFAPKGAAGDGWIGLPRELEHLPEMEMAAAHFGGAPDFRLDSYPAIAAAAAATGLPCILPSCITHRFPTLQPLAAPDPTPVVARELWLLFHERRTADPAILALKSWIREVFPDPNRCLCGNCTRSGTGAD